MYYVANVGQSGSLNIGTLRELFFISVAEYHMLLIILYLNFISNSSGAIHNTRNILYDIQYIYYWNVICIFLFPWSLMFIKIWIVIYIYARFHTQYLFTIDILQITFTKIYRLNALYAHSRQYLFSIKESYWIWLSFLYTFVHIGSYSYLTVL